MYHPSYGGNPTFDTGQLALTGAVQQIPVPVGLNGPGSSIYDNINWQLSSMVIRITSGTHDVYFGNSSNVTTSTGARIPANQVYTMTAPRSLIYVIGQSGDTVSWCYEYAL
jgi:hypothetical protein